MKDGDILLFSGKWSDRASRWIKIATFSKWTHVAGCVRITKDDLTHINLYRTKCKKKKFPVDINTWEDGIYLFESTTLCDQPCVVQCNNVSGVQIHKIQDRTKNYDVMGHRSLTTSLSEIESQLLTMRVLHAIETPYDYSGALLTATIVFKLWLGKNKANDINEMLCSEVVLECYQWAMYDRITRKVTSGALPPRDLAKWQHDLYDKLVFI